MSDSSWEQVKAIFEEALALPSAERAAFLDERCEGASALRAEVEQLLAAHEEAGSFLGADETLTRSESGPMEGEGTVIGRYKLLQLIGEGGFGSVFMAEQEHPVRRKVALKIIKLGMDTRQVIARFEAERQALALMDHPNIARVLDAGSTDNGRPYFVMELVRGVPITEYCDTNALGTHERLELFQQVCSAVQHAHQKGIIHRDLKPSNVMVTLHDGTPVPKVIDFGIAKATNQRLTERTLFTQYHQFIGTPEYMSPEQAEMSGLDVDTRSDIYSLGVLLYELLTGTTPVDATRLRSMAYSEIHRVIREEEPHKPSARVSTLGAEATTTAKQRGTDTQTLRRALSGDLDWIVMKALEKDRTRRYDTANALMLDIRRHLANEPVAAGPPSAAYRARKFLRRNRASVTVAGALAATLLAGLAAATYGFVQARRAADSAQSVNAFFADMLASVDPRQWHLHSAYRVADLAPDVDAQFSHDVPVAEMLRRSAGRVEESFVGKPRLEATMREVLGTTLLGLNDPGEALKQFRRAHQLRLKLHGPGHPDVLRSRVQITQALHQGSRLVEAEESGRQVMEDLERIRGVEDPLTMYATSLYAQIVRERGRGDFETSDELFETVLERQERILGPDHRDTVRTLTQWTHNFTWRGNGEEALKRASKAYERAIAVYSPDDDVVLDNEQVLGLSHAFLGQYDEARKILIPSFEKHRRVYGDDHYATRRVAFSLARAYRGDRDKQIEYFLWAMQGTGDAAQVYPDANAWLAARDVSWQLPRVGRADEALEILERQLEFWAPGGEGEAYAGPERSALIVSNMKAPYRAILMIEGRWEELRELQRERLAELRTAAEKEDAGIGNLNNYAWGLLTALPEDLRDPQEARRWAERAIERTEDDPAALSSFLDTLAQAHAAAGDLSEALKVQRRTMDVLMDVESGQENESGLSYMTTRVVRFARELGRREEAREAVRAATAWFADRFDGDASRHAGALLALGYELLNQGFLVEAEQAATGAVRVARGAELEARLFQSLLLAAGVREQTAAIDEAHRLYRRVYAVEADGSGWDEAVAVNQLAHVLLKAGRAGEAAELLRRPGTGDDRRMALLLSLQGKAEQAEPLWRRVVANDWMDAEHEDRPWNLARHEADYARCLMELGRWDEARRRLELAERLLREWVGPGSVHLGQVDRRLAAARKRQLDPWLPRDLR